jgi:hypothetical protein
MTITTQIKRRFNAKVEKRGGQHSCWVWTGSLRDGYGCMRVGPSRIAAHRIAWAIWYDIDTSEVPKELGHTCGRRACVNPSHIGRGKSNFRSLVKGR